MAKEISQLNQFQNSETFIYLLDRIRDIENLIIQTQKIRALDVDIINLLESQGIQGTRMIYTYTRLTYVLYRSMFQSAYWENDKKAEIQPDAYSYTTAQKNTHEEIIFYVDKILAHQDIHNQKEYADKENAKGNKNKRPPRGVYPPQNINGKQSYLVWHSFPVHVDELMPLIKTMEKAVDARNAQHNQSLISF